MLAKPFSRCRMHADLSFANAYSWCTIYADLHLSDLIYDSLLLPSCGYYPVFTRALFACHSQLLLIGQIEVQQAYA